MKLEALDTEWILFSSVFLTKNALGWKLRMTVELRAQRQATLKYYLKTYKILNDAIGFTRTMKV